MKGDHIFIANGDSCPICSALHGTLVNAGYKPHANCSCQTVSATDGDECTFEATEESLDRPRNAGESWMITLNIVVTCPDGTTHDAPFLAMALETLFTKRGIHAVEDIALEECQECEDGEFLCC